MGLNQIEQSAHSMQEKGSVAVCSSLFNLALGFLPLPLPLHLNLTKTPLAYAEIMHKGSHRSDLTFDSFRGYNLIRETDKAKPVARQGRKATGLNRWPGYLGKGGPAFFMPLMSMRKGMMI